MSDDLAKSSRKPLKLPSPPAGTGAHGRRLWVAVLSEYEMEAHELAILREMVRTVDELEELAEIVRTEGTMQPGAG